ncbi:MAG: hypothetical protein RLY20_2142 [Verrucomicrobiota bacterium]|jgi:hypothetical protein
MRRRPLLLLALLGPGGFAASSYLDGLGLISQMWAFMLSLGWLFCGIPALSAMLALLYSKSWGQRMLIFSGLLFFQVGIVFFVLPPGAYIEMVGISHRLGRYPARQLGSCAQTLMQRYNEGALATNSTSLQLYPPFRNCAAIAAESELPSELRGRFRCVGIGASYDDLAVYFEVEPQIGIVCTKRSIKNDAFHRRLGDGVYAYHYQRP